MTNPYLETEQYPLPHPEDLMICLTGGCKFTKLDLSAAYQQMLLDEKSCPFVTINSQRGLYRYLHLPFGVSSAPAVFRKQWTLFSEGFPSYLLSRWHFSDRLVWGWTSWESFWSARQIVKTWAQNWCTNFTHYMLHWRLEWSETGQKSVPNFSHRSRIALVRLQFWFITIQNYLWDWLVML